MKTSINTGEPLLHNFNADNESRALAQRTLTIVSEVLRNIRRSNNWWILKNRIAEKIANLAPGL